MNKVSLILGIIISLGVISGAVYRFDISKASKESVVQVANDFHIYKLEQHRRYLQQRIWDLQRQYPQQYMRMIEYQRLVEELKLLDRQIDAYYRRKG